MTDINIEALKAVAKASTPGPWSVDGPLWNQIVWSSAENRVCFLAHSSGLNDARDAATGAFIAAANPSAVLALIDRVEKAEAKQRRAPVQGFSAGIPWEMHLRAYDAYSKRWAPQKALIEGGCRGGFSVGELDQFIPGWREELSEITRLRALLARAVEALRAFGCECTGRCADHEEQPAGTANCASVVANVISNEIAEAIGNG